MLSRHCSIGASVELRPALEAVVRLCRRKQRVAVHAYLLLRDYVLLFLVETLAWKERVFVDVIGDLPEDRLRELINQAHSLLTQFDVT